MSPVVFVANEQDDHKVDTDRWLALANDVLSNERMGDYAEVNVLFVDEKSIADLNERFLGKSGPTDVLSFPMEDEPAESGRMPDSGGSGPGGSGDDDGGGAGATMLLGDVVICPAVAKRNAPDHAGTYDNEIALLVVHGLMHLLGMDHDDETEAAEMEKREKAHLDALYGELPLSAWSTMSGDEDA